MLNRAEQLWRRPRGGRRAARPVSLSLLPFLRCLVRSTLILVHYRSYNSFALLSCAQPATTSRPRARRARFARSPVSWTTRLQLSLFAVHSGRYTFQLLSYTPPWPRRWLDTIPRHLRAFALLSARARLHQDGTQPMATVHFTTTNITKLPTLSRHDGPGNCRVSWLVFGRTDSEDAGARAADCEHRFVWWCGNSGRCGKWMGYSVACARRLRRSERRCHSSRRLNSARRSSARGISVAVERCREVEWLQWAEGKACQSFAVAQ